MSLCLWIIMASKTVIPFPDGKKAKALPLKMQIHEFESLLFSDIDVFKNNFDNSELDFSVLEEAVQEFPNPEDINTRPTLAPSKRLIKAIPGYEKIIYGDCLASEIGLKKIREKCPLFNQWFSDLLSI